MWARLRLFFTFWDSRFEDLDRKNWMKTVYRDLSAGLITALTAIPMAMGFAVAMGLRPELGIIAGAVACIVGRTFGGSKYQVYGPTAAFIPIIGGLVSAATARYLAAGYSEAEAATAAHGFLVFVSILAGVVLMLMGLFGLGKMAELVPNSIVVGFTVGIGITIALSNVGYVLGYSSPIKGNLIEKVSLLWQFRQEFNYVALILALVTFAVTVGLLRVSIFIPAPLIALGVCTLAATTVLAGSGLQPIGDIPTNFFQFTGPILPALTPGVVGEVLYYVVAIVFVSGIESLLCSSMADRLANNQKTKFNPDKEFWGQGMVQIITPLLNGFPCTGALARTATSIKAGAVTPLAGYFKGVLKLIMVYFLARYLAMVPMACIGGILLWVAYNMIKPAEIRHVVTKMGTFHALLMAFTAVMVPLTDFLTGVLLALVIYAVAYWFVERQPAVEPTQVVRVDEERGEVVDARPAREKTAAS